MKHTTKQTTKKLLAMALAALMLLSFAACSGAPNDMEGGMGGAPNNSPYLPPSGSNDDAAEVPDSGITGDEIDAPTFVENPFISTEEQAVSTFSADVDTASYTYFRKLVNAGYDFEDLQRMSSAFRTEEFINYFSYEATDPVDGELFGLKQSITSCPWNANTYLLTMTLKAESAPVSSGNNLVFLIDVSGSMMSEDKLPLLKKTFGYLVDQLCENDRISIVTYSGREEVVLEGCEGNKKDLILSKIDSLRANGSTNGESGLRRAYEIATEAFIEGGNNRIIMASDGDLNVGISSADELKTYVETQRDLGIYLSILGFGTGNYRDRNMEALADNGNGVYYYIDGESEAERIFSDKLLGTLYTVAEDVKLQVTFDPSRVASYRLIGYENRMLSEDDFLDDTKDAGEVGANHTVTVCYELTLCEGARTEGAEWLSLAVNYKEPGSDTSVPPRSYPIGYADYQETATPDDLFRTSLIQFCMLLHGSKYLPEGTSVASILETLQTMDLSASNEKAEFVALLQKLNG